MLKSLKVTGDGRDERMKGIWIKHSSQGGFFYGLY